ncbi:Hypothetical protein LBF_3113 [Leptospira biflexa serovar Patoc strain 'Patoc 1 (Ames)']|uniref:Uncharacterized protein n=1 Tax=Leptospira biflexa serovar Patoc (strain Patoc 1 / ATCC 23582 / Paris) TaxID=456481 RepID=B0SQP3_LEPBP|nr:hypothetical protein [Leptospira biflexa]ABZ95582.1 Hypothetical protein LBF_3113 [Leptospira biflexa serovar Patoc strain 'Patoc 1 (Ames)']ABZ99290.1 Conserved hypothetical protein; putative signal peptide [Leptospira biflexa serovar Patoc strain 'Patoc 1 (Paris)']
MKGLLFSLVFIFATSLLADGLPSADEFLNMDLDKSIRLVESLSKEEAKVLVSDLRAEVKKSYPKADHFYFLISHLEEIQAIEKEQARLKSLLWVYVLAFVLFTGFLGLILLRQRKAIRDINQLLSK